jgi:Fe-S-cluster-containing dehydrogenase component
MSQITGPDNNIKDSLWRSLEELDSHEKGPALAKKFPAAASILNHINDALDRRQFMQLIGASAALAGISACTKMPAEKIIPFVIAPDDFVPGASLQFATSAAFGGFSKSIIATSHEGRPTKLDGNPKHPAMLGKSDLFTQAELLQLYDPERSKVVSHLGEISTWDEFSAVALEEIKKWKLNGGQKVRILTNHISSPVLLNEIETFLHRYPKAKWHSYEACVPSYINEAAKKIFGKALRPVYEFEKANVVLSLDSDFLGPGPCREKYTRDFMSSRQPFLESNTHQPPINRLYMIDSTVSITGAAADHRWPLKYSQVYLVALELATRLGVKHVKAETNPTSAQIKTLLNTKFMDAIVDELRNNPRTSIVLAGEHHLPELHELVFAINDHLNNVGSTIYFLEPNLSEKQFAPESFESLNAEIAGGEVDSLFILSANPVYDTAATLSFKENLEKVKLRVRLGQYNDETSFHCHWHLPESHFLESWCDARSFDGTISLQQPLISPLYDSRSSTELFSILNEKAGRTDLQLLKTHLHEKGNLISNNTNPTILDKDFEELLSNGFIAHTNFPIILPKVHKDWHLTNISAKEKIDSAVNLEAVFKPDPTIFDGRYSNNAWLQELPKPILQLTWSNAIVLSPATAKQFDLVDGDEVEIKFEGRTIKGSTLRVPGNPDGSITLYLGYGRTRAGSVGNNHGYNAFTLQDHKSPWFAPAVTLKKLGTRKSLATTHFHSSMEGRDLIVHSDFATYKKSPEKIVKEELKTPQASMISNHEYKDQAWAMNINLSTCIGCNGCTIACQAENNIPVVGEEQVLNSREMHWIRVDRYFEGSQDNPRVFFQPVPCMHCEKAPCEEVCPTAATNHSSEGINQMVYNRCVGTRYCSNNCPYKVRRFNYLQYSDLKSEPKKLMYNPDVTLRSRGVMEKCTYCIQRIQTLRIQAEKENRPLKDGEIQTACQQACPTNAIVFGDKNDPQSRVSKLRAQTLNYSLLNELGTQPRTTYLAALKNTNRILETKVEKNEL